MTTKTTKEALDLLVKHRKALIDRGRVLAREIARARGAVTARDVRERMIEEGSYDPMVGDYWLGAVFTQRAVFTWTGDWFAYSHTDQHRSCHANRIKVWRLSEPKPQHENENEKIH